MEEALTDTIEVIESVLKFLSKVNDKALTIEKNILAKKIQKHLNRTEKLVQENNQKKVIISSDANVTNDYDYNDVEVEPWDGNYDDVIVGDVPEIYDDCRHKQHQELYAQQKENKKEEVESGGNLFKRGLKKATNAVGSKLEMIKSSQTQGIRKNIVPPPPPPSAKPTSKTRLSLGNIDADQFEECNYVAASPVFGRDSTHSIPDWGTFPRTPPRSPVFGPKSPHKLPVQASTLPRPKSPSKGEMLSPKKKDPSKLNSGFLNNSALLNQKGNLKASDNSAPSLKILKPYQKADNSSIESEKDDEEDFKNIDVADLYQGMWDCNPDEENELKFSRGQIVQIISREYDKSGWWIAKRKNKMGFVPKNYLMEAYER